MAGDESSPYVIMLDYRRISGGSMHEPDYVYILLKFISGLLRPVSVCAAAFQTVANTDL
jgi:hypothetical protein